MEKKSPRKPPSLLIMPVIKELSLLCPTSMESGSKSDFEQGIHMNVFDWHDLVSN